MRILCLSAIAALLVAPAALAKPTSSTGKATTATAAATTANAKAAAGLQAMRELNLIVLDTLTTNGQEVEGRTFVNKLVSQNFTNFGIGSSTQGSASSRYDVLSVVGNATGSFRLKAGYANGQNGTLGNTARIGGNVGYVDFNATNGAVGVLVAGGNLTTSFNVNNNSVTYGGSAASGINGARKDATLAAGGANDVGAGLVIRMSELTTNLNALSTQLANLPSLGTITSTNNALNYSGATDGFAVFTMTEAAFTNQNANFDNLFTRMPSGTTTIINVLGTNLVQGGNINNKALNQSVIWNFNQAQNLSVKGFHGSILAPKATLTNSSAIEGSIVALNMRLNGEVHLGTYNGNGNFVPTNAVPEPASWAMLLVGFGALGAAIRKRRALGIA
ncbi:collagen-binding domain-containing protein [Sphingomonas sp. HT-1]|uniref:collagen-binding domain-containing protein n=1 Tax=unclassified Sphingomonas TaxID=196159 RepID=UPI0002F38565|nr:MULTISPECIES: collagen-binding domain-containing protein [unclassified Sphingomonas]KTF68611.1 PEP-CTERM domain protein [Sphingomonas sp. WG]